MDVNEAPTSSRQSRCSRDVRLLRAAIERRLQSLVPPPVRGDLLAEAMRHALLAPGKRIRPLLTMLVAQELGIGQRQVLDSGCAVEMVHAASLVIDDLPSMDNDGWRRGQPSTHVVYGEDLAILAAISLLSRAYATIAGDRYIDASKRSELVLILARAVGTDGLATGQFRDLRSTGAPNMVDRIAAANHLKTGMLFLAGVEIAAAVAEVGEERRDELRLFAGHLGQAFQLMDDLADGVPVASTGRSPDDHKATLLSVLGRDEVRRRLDGHLARAVEPFRPDGQLAAFVRGIFAAPLQTGASPAQRQPDLSQPSVGG